jgi:hypothetical protein
LGEVAVPSAREIRSKLKRDEDDERKRRTDAVLAVAEAAATAVKARAANDAALRETFESALKVRGDDAERVRALRASFESALGDAPEVIAAELAAGQAVNAAMSQKVTQVKLAELTEQRVEDLRRWAQAAKQDGASPPVKPSAGRAAQAGPEGEDRPVTGYAVVAAPDPVVDGAAEAAIG